MWNLNDRAILSNNDKNSPSFNSTAANRELKIEEIEPEIKVNKKIISNESKSSNDLVLLPLESKQVINLDDISSEDCDLLCMKLFFSIIEWSYSLPLFYNLSQIDQINLLKNSWSDLFMICLAQSNISIDNLSENFISNNQTSINEDELLNDIDNNNNNNSDISKEISEETTLYIKQYLEKLNLYLEKLKSLIENSNTEFYSYLKAIILFNPGKLFQNLIYSSN